MVTCRGWPASRRSAAFPACMARRGAARRGEAHCRQVRSLREPRQRGGSSCWGDRPAGWDDPARREGAEPRLGASGGVTGALLPLSHRQLREAPAGERPGTKGGSPGGRRGCGPTALPAAWESSAARLLQPRPEPGVRRDLAGVSCLLPLQRAPPEPSVPVRNRLGTSRFPSSHGVFHRTRRYPVQGTQPLSADEHHAVIRLTDLRAQALGWDPAAPRRDHTREQGLCALTTVRFHFPSAIKWLRNPAFPQGAGLHSFLQSGAHVWCH